MYNKMLDFFFINYIVMLHCVIYGRLIIHRNILVSGDLLHDLNSWLLSSVFQFGPHYRVYAKKWTKLKISYLTLSCF